MVKYSEWFGKQEHSFHYETNDQVEEGINNFSVKSNTNLLCVLARKNGLIRFLFHKSVSKKLTYHTKMPLLIIQE
ncbi:hypothetical protein N9V83_01095 [Flavobacteriales bacterium]|nr:hypothetical protein [Flavobacteriales bacterium]